MPHDSADNQFWIDFRRQMPIAQDWAYFDHAAVAPIPEPTREAVCRWADEACQSGDVVWPSWNRGIERARKLGAQMIGADLEEIALVPNTTAGINLVAEGFPWREGDNVVTFADEFPSNQYPWINQADKGVETRRVPVDGALPDLNRLEDACDERTRIVSVSWVGYASGYRLNVTEAAEIAHRKGALLFLDAIQGLGVFPLDVNATGVDFLAADGHKWMLGPEGAGLMYVRREHLDLLRPLGVGWNSVRQANDFSKIDLQLSPCAKRYEGGTQNMVGFLGFAESLALLAGYGTENIAARILEVTDLACRRLEAFGARVVSHRAGDHRSGIVSFEVPGVDPATVRGPCEKHNVVLNARGGWIRVSPHAYNDASDIDRLIEALEAIKSQ